MSDADIPAQQLAEPVVVRGHVTALRLYDIAYAIDLALAESLWAGHAAGRAARRGLATTPAKAVSFGVAPLTIQLEPAELVIEGVTLRASLAARLYDFGAASLILTVPAAGLGFAEYTRRANAVERAVGAGAATRLWQERLDGVRNIVGKALDRPAKSSPVEDFLIAVVNELDMPLDSAALLARIDLAPLLSGDYRPLSAGALQDLLRRQYSYYEDDLVVLTWDRAFIYEPRGDSDIADVLEVANVQLVEMRYYDELLDDELPRMNDQVEAARRGVNMLAARRYATLARRFYTLVAEVTELTEKVDNALQVTEDVYLARVYGAALELFRVGLVSAAVQRKLTIMRDTYGALYDEASSARTTLIEIAVLLLIFLEVVLAVVRP